MVCAGQRHGRRCVALDDVRVRSLNTEFGRQQSQPAIRQRAQNDVPVDQMRGKPAQVFEVHLAVAGPGGLQRAEVLVAFQAGLSRAGVERDPQAIELVPLQARAADALPRCLHGATHAAAHEPGVFRKSENVGQVELRNLGN